MAARRFFVEGTQSVGSVVEIGGSDAHKLAHVLRLRPGDRIEIVDSTATAFAAAIETTGRVVRAGLLEVVEDRSPYESLAVEIAQAAPKGQRMDFVVEKCTELGATAIVPFFCERSVTRRLGAEKLARWRRLARVAAQQSGRHDVPPIREPMEFGALLETFDSYDAVLFAWELAPPAPLLARLESVLPACRRVLVAVGPEGGFTHAEAEAASGRGATLISLGRRILRTDTAAVALLAVMGALAS